MRLLKNNFPYPVITDSHSDYLDGLFKAEYLLQEDVLMKDNKLEIKYELECLDIQRLIDSNQASIYVHIECHKTLYRKLYKVEENIFSVNLDQDSFKSNVSLTSLILANEDISNYQVSSLKQAFFKDYQFGLIKKGEILGYLSTKEILVNEVDDLVRLSSIIKIVKSTGKIMSVNYDNDVIIIYLPQRQFDNYINFGLYSETMIDAIIIPATLFVLDSIVKSRGMNLFDLKWFKVLSKKLESMGYPLNDLLEGNLDTLSIAFEIFNNPLDRMFNELEEGKEHE